jgi:hypothetical protein
MLKIINAIFSSNLFTLFMGSFLTFIFAFFLNKSAQSSSYNFKIGEKRIEAYQNIIDVVRELNHFMGIKDDFPHECKLRDNDTGYLFNFDIPEIFINEKVFLDFMYAFMNSFSQNRIWLDENTTSELEFIKDYLGSCWDIIHEKPENEIRLFGLVLSREIEDEYNNLENVIRSNISKKIVVRRIPSTYNRAFSIRAKRKQETMLYQYFLKPKGKRWFGFFACCAECPEITKGNECPIKSKQI